LLNRSWPPARAFKSLLRLALQVRIPDLLQFGLRLFQRGTETKKAHGTHELLM
jgi:hypothetical protein